MVVLSERAMCLFISCTMISREGTIHGSSLLSGTSRMIFLLFVDFYLYLKLQYLQNLVDETIALDKTVRSGSMWIGHLFIRLP